MKNQATIVLSRYNDPDVSRWEPAYRKPIHAMVLLADDSKDRLDQSLATVQTSIAGLFEELVTERARSSPRSSPAAR